MHKMFALVACAIVAAGSLLIPTISSAQASNDVKHAYQRMSDFLRTQQAFSVDMTLEYTALIGEETQWLVTTYSLAFERPNHAVMRVKNPQLEYELYLQNDEWIHYLPAVNQYVAQPATMNAAELVSRAGVGPISDAMVIFMQVVLPEPFKVTLEHALRMEHKGEVEIDGEVYEKVFLDFDAVKWDAWISKGDQPVLHRVVPQLPVVENHYMEQFQKHVELDVVMDFKNWNFNADEVREKLTFAQRDTAERIESFEVPQTDDPEEALLGKPAPLFELTSLDGSTFNLADKIGKEIIVLDFWATWCAPCRRGMPIMEKVTGEFADSDVALYTVNLQEDEATIKGFLEETGLDVNVLMDTTSRVQEAYFAFAIPQTVIIGKDGIVQAVHVGVSPALEEELRAQLGVLAEGGKLVSTE